MEKNKICSTINRSHRFKNVLRPTYFFTKTAELASAESSLKSLQNQLQNTQAELDSLLQAKQEQQTKQEQEKEKQEALKQAQLEKAQAKLNALLAQCSTPPSTDLVAIKRILESLNNLQAKLLSI